MTTETSPSSDLIPDERTDTTAANSELAEETTRSKTSLHRRSYLKLLGVSAVPLAAERAGAAETDYGYGYSGYGEGGYGGVEEKPMIPTNPPHRR